MEHYGQPNSCPAAPVPHPAPAPTAPSARRSLPSIAAAQRLQSHHTLAYPAYPPSLIAVLSPKGGRRLLPQSSPFRTEPASIATADEEINEEKAVAIEESGLPGVTIRSVLTCQSKRGVCHSVILVNLNSLPGMTESCFLRTFQVFCPTLYHIDAMGMR